MRTHVLEPTLQTLHGHFSRELPPALTIRSGDRVRFRTLDVNWGAFANPDPFEAPRPFPGRDLERDPGHAMCGPVTIEGARAGTTLEVRVIELRTGTWGWTAAGGRSTEWHDKLGLAALPAHLLRFALDPDAGTGRTRDGLTVALRPFLGIVGMPPDEPGRHSTVPPRACGGNIDCRELVEGSTLFLPIPVDGARFSAGDGHALQGDGEVAGPALECPMERAVLEFHLRPEMRLVRPRASTPAGWITFGFDADLNEATRVALSDMLDLVVELSGGDRALATAYASLLVSLRVTQIVNGVKGVHAILPHAALEAIRTRGRPRD
jgi:acetamidase/formamidase